MEKEEILEEMGKKIVETMEPPEAKKILLAVVDGNDLYEEMIGQGAAPGNPPPKKRGTRRKKNVGPPSGPTPPEV
jgi:hypothetical protein